MDMKRDYYEDVQLFSSGIAVFWFVVLIIFLAIFPFLLKNYYVYVANYMAINIIVAIGLNLLVGYTGQISLGHAGFFAIGAYGTIIFMSKVHLPFLLALPAAALVSALFGLLLGLPALRLDGPYLSIATLGFGLTITQVIGRIDLFGGRQGLHAPELIIGLWHLDTDREFYYLLITITVLMATAARNLVKTRVGRAFIAIRDADIAAETMGVNLMLYKTMAFAVSAFYAGVAGGLYAFVLRFIEPEIFTLLMSILFLSMVVVGGLGSILGAIAGACLLSWLDLQLRNILSIPYVGQWLEHLSKSFFSITGVSNIQYIIFGLIMVLIMLFEPYGIFGFWVRIKKYWKTWPFSPDKRTMIDFLQMLVSGIAVGSSYALMGLAMVIIYKTSEVVNFAQGEMALLSSFLTLMLLEYYRVPFSLAIPATLVFAVMLGFFLEFAVLRRAKAPNVLGMIIITIGLEMILMGFVSWKFGADHKTLPFPISPYDSLAMGNIYISSLEMLTLVVTLVLMVILFLFLRFSKLGVAMKATQQNKTAARLMGIRTNRILMITWGISSLVGCTAGLLVSPVIMHPYMMWDPMLKGFAAAVMGGMTSLPGSVFGAYLLGVIENLFGGYISIEFKSVVAFVIIVLVLCFKPSGLFARHYTKKV